MKIFRKNFIQITATLLLLLLVCCQPGWSNDDHNNKENGGAGVAVFVDLKQQQQSLNKTDNEKLIVPKNTTTTTNIISQLIKSTASASSASTNAQRRSYEDDDYETQSLFKSLIPKSSTFKKPIKKIFRSWFEPDPEALDDESKKSSYYFARPKSNPLHSLPQRNNRNNPIQQDSSSSSINRQPIAHHPIGSNYGNRLTKYSNHDQQQQQQQQQYSNIASSPYTNKASSRQFSIGDPVNGRGLTLSFGDQSNEPSSASSYSQTVEQKPQYGYNSGNAGNPSPGLSLSFGGNGGGDSGGGGGGSGMSFNIGRGNGGDGRGMSLSLGRGNSGGSGLSFSFGGGGGGGSGNGYAQSGSASYPSYSSSYGGGSGYNNYGVSYGNNYNNYDYNQPVFSMVMPSSGKQVIEYNQHPSKMKMKINSSPRVKITTNTKDPLDKPGLEDEVIQEDIFGPPEPFDKPNRTSTSSMNETMQNGIHNMTMMMGHFNQSMYPYSPYSPYPHYYQYPYNYYYHNYYQQHYPSQYYQYMMNVSSMYPNMMMMPPMAAPPMSPMPQQQQPPQMKPPPMQQQQQQQQYRPNYSQYAASTMNMPTKTNTIQPSLMPMTYNMPVSTSYSMLPTANTMQSQSQLSSIYGLNTGQIKTTYPPTSSMGQQPSLSGSGLYTQTSWQPYGQQQQMINSYQQQQPKSLMIDNNNNHGYKRSSASRNYQKDMLTLNSLQGTMRKSSYNQRKSLQQPLHSMKRNSNKYYTYDLMQTSESQLNPQQQQQQYPGYNLTTLALMNDATRNYYYQPMASSQQAMPGSQQPMPGTGAGYSFFNNTMMGQHYNGSSSSYWNPYNYYYSPYYYNYYNNYYNYAKKYYETYYANQLQQQNNKTSSSTTSKYYPRKNITSITGFSQNSFDYEQSKRFGHRAIKYQGGSTKEEKARVILDIRPRVTIKMLNKTEQAMQDEELKKKKKDHIFKTHMEIIMETTTTPKPYYYNNYDSYYGYNYGPEVDDFGWTHEPPYGSTETTTLKPRTTTTTRRRTTTTESSSSSEVSEEENGTSESTSGESSTEEDDQSSSSTTTEASDTESVSEEVEEESDSAEQQSSSSSSTTTTTESSVSEEGDGGGGDEEVIDANEDDDDNNKSSDNNDEDQDEDNRKSDDQDETAEGGGEEENGGEEEEEGEEEQKIIDSNQLVGNNNVTVSPELVQAMIKALQEALGVTTTTTMTPIEDLDGFNEETTGNNEDDNNQIDEQSEHEENDMITTTTMKPSILKPKNGIKGIIETGRRRLPTNVITTTVRNVTQVRLKTPVLSMRSGKTTPSSSQRRFFTTPRPIFGSNSNDNDNDDDGNIETGIKNIKNLIDLTTTSPLLIVNKLQPTQLNTPKIIDGDALLNNFDINNLTDDERRQMLTNILGVIQNRAPATTIPTTATNNIFDTRIIRSSTTKSKQTKTSTKRSSSKQKSTSTTTKTPKSTRLLPVTKANNVRIISSLDELNKETIGGVGVNGSGDKSNQQQPIYVVLLPQNKKKK